MDKINNFMNIFVNVSQFSMDPDNDSFWVRRLYSGTSPEKLRKKIIDDLREEWINFPNIERDFGSVYAPRTFIETGKIIDGIISNNVMEAGGLIDYTLAISEPYSDISQALDFYKGYYSMDEDEREHYTDVSFYFYGDYAIKIQGTFPYAAELMTEFEVAISQKSFNKLMSLIK